MSKVTTQIVKRVIIGTVLIVVVFVGVLHVNNDIGIRKEKIVSDIRSSQRIDENWITDGETSDSMAAYISYPKDNTDHTYSIFVNRPGLSFGYFFRAGGSLTGADKYISEFTLDGYQERAFIATSALKVARLEINDSQDIQVIEFDSEKPFSIVLPINAGELVFYDINGEAVAVCECPL